MFTEAVCSVKEAIWVKGEEGVGEEVGVERQIRTLPS